MNFFLLLKLFSLIIQFETELFILLLWKAVIPGADTLPPDTFMEQSISGSQFRVEN